MFGSASGSLQISFVPAIAIASLPAAAQDLAVQAGQNAAVGARKFSVVQ
jgi:hypothetical protein